MAQILKENKLEDIKLNVILITYNQEEYVKPALESILKQNTSFAFNIIVADDASPDNTYNVIKEYAKSQPNKFHFLEQTSNLGYIKNYQRAFASCDAEYIAIMEGDDLWTSDKHLQNHVDFLDKHPESSMSFNRHIRFFQTQDREEIFDWETDGNVEYMSTEDLIFKNRIGNLSCCVFKQKYIQKLEPKIFDTVFADWLLGMIMGQYGSLAYQKEVSSLYRIHDDGQWTRMTNKEQDRQILEQIDSYNELLDYKYDEEFSTLKKWKMINVYGDKSLRGRIKSITPQFIIDIFRN